MSVAPPIEDVGVLKWLIDLLWGGLFLLARSAFADFQKKLDKQEETFQAHVQEFREHEKQDRHVHETEAEEAAQEALEREGRLREVELQVKTLQAQATKNSLEHETFARSARVESMAQNVHRIPSLEQMQTMLFEKVQNMEAVLNKTREESGDQRVKIAELTTGMAGLQQNTRQMAETMKEVLDEVRGLSSRFPERRK